MSYTHLKWRPLRDSHLKEVFEHTDMYLFDAYGMLRGLPPAGGDGGGGNFSIALVLLCIIDGLAAEVWPGRDRETDQEKRFKRLIRCRFPWGPEGKCKWVDKGNAADQLYNEFRNPLVHDLAQDKAASSRPAGYVEPIIGKWGSIPNDMQDIAKIDALPRWDNAWPILSQTNDDRGNPRFKLAVAGLYWAVKQLAKDMVAGAQSSQSAEKPNLSTSLQ